MQLWMNAFLKWLQSEDEDVPELVWKQLFDTHTAQQSGNATLMKNSVAELDATVEDLLLPLFERFQKWGCETSPTFRYWDGFLQCVKIILLNIQAEREGNWVAHLHSQEAMLPFFFATNRMNYSRWMPAYILDMLE